MLELLSLDLLKMRKKKRHLMRLDNWKNIPQRPKKLISTREKTARNILKQLESKKFANDAFFVWKANSND